MRPRPHAPADLFADADPAHEDIAVVVHHALAPDVALVPGIVGIGRDGTDRKATETDGEGHAIAVAFAPAVTLPVAAAPRLAAAAPAATAAFSASPTSDTTTAAAPGFRRAESCAKRHDCNKSADRLCEPSHVPLP